MLSLKWCSHRFVEIGESGLAYSLSSSFKSKDRFLTNDWTSYIIISAVKTTVKKFQVKLSSELLMICSSISVIKVNSTRIVIKLFSNSFNVNMSPRWRAWHSFHRTICKSIRLFLGLLLMGPDTDVEGILLSMGTTTKLWTLCVPFIFFQRITNFIMAGFHSIKNFR